MSPAHWHPKISMSRQETELDLETVSTRMNLTPSPIGGATSTVNMPPEIVLPLASPSRSEVPSGFRPVMRCCVKPAGVCSGLKLMWRTRRGPPKSISIFCGALANEFQFLSVPSVIRNAASGNLSAVTGALRESKMGCSHAGGGGGGGGVAGGGRDTAVSVMFGPLTST